VYRIRSDLLFLCVILEAMESLEGYPVSLRDMDVTTVLLSVGAR
jgi:hypothetical protein